MYEDLQIIPEGTEEFNSYRQCINFELAGKGFQPRNTYELKENFIKTKFDGKTIIEKNPENNEDLKEYLKIMYGFNIKNL